MYGGIPCIRVNFWLPQMFQANGVTSIPVLVPNEFVGTGISNAYIFYALIEEIIGRLVGIGPTHLLVRLYHQHGQTFAWYQLHSGFVPFISSVRESGRFTLNEVSPCPALSGTPLLKLVWSRTPFGSSRDMYSAKLMWNGRGRHVSRTHLILQRSSGSAMGGESH